MYLPCLTFVCVSVSPGAGAAAARPASGAMWAPPAAAQPAAAYYPQQQQMPPQQQMAAVAGAVSMEPSYIAQVPCIVLSLARACVSSVHQALQRPSGPGSGPVPNRYVPNVLPARRSVAELSASEARRQELYQRCVELLAQLPADGTQQRRRKSLYLVVLIFTVDPVASSLPQLLVHYHSLYPMDDGQRERGAPRVLPVVSHAFKALSARCVVFLFLSIYLFVHPYIIMS